MYTKIIKGGYIMKKFIAGLMCGLLLFSVGYATTRTVEAYESDIRIMVDGEVLETDVPPIVFQERTYVPVRFIAEALNKKVDWNEETKVIEIKDMQINNGNNLIGDEIMSKEKNNTSVSDDVYEEPRQPQGIMTKTILNRQYEQIREKTFSTFTENGIEILVINGDKYVKRDYVTKIKMEYLREDRTVIIPKDAPMYEFRGDKVIPYDYFMQHIMPKLEELLGEKIS